MSEKYAKFEEQLNDLIGRGSRLIGALRYEYYSEQIENQITKRAGEDKLEKILEKMPKFKDEYQHWYSEALSLVKQVLPDRFNDFISYYQYSRVGKTSRTPIIRFMII